MEKQHVQLPNDASDLEPKDKLVYLSIRRFMNKDTKIAFPSLQTISDVSGASIPTIRKIITKLEDLDYFEVSKKGRGQQYKFNELKSFEPLLNFLHFPHSFYLNRFLNEHIEILLLIFLPFQFLKYSIYHHQIYT